MTIEELLAFKDMTSLLNSTSLCVGSACLNETDVQEIKQNPITNFVCNGQECLNSTDVARIKNLPNKVNSTQHCIGPDCLIASDLTTLKTLSSIVNSSLICSGSNCLNSTDLVELKSLIYNSMSSSPGEPISFPPPTSTLTSTSLSSSLSSSNTPSVSSSSSFSSGQTSPSSSTSASSLSSSTSSSSPTSTSVPMMQIDGNSTVETLAGSHIFCIDGFGSNVVFGSLGGLAIAPNGTIYVADYGSHVIRAIHPSGQVVTVAGSPSAQGLQNGPAHLARFSAPWSVAVSSNGTVYVTDNGNSLVRAISPSGVVSTVTSVGTFYYSPVGLKFAPNGTLYVADTGNSVIRAISPSGVVSLVAGTEGTLGYVDGTGPAAQFYSPYGLAVGSNGVIYVADTGNNRIRMISTSRVVTTYAGMGDPSAIDGAGTTATFQAPYDVVMYSNGTLYVADTYNHLIRAISPSKVVSSTASIILPQGIVAASNGSIFVTESGNRRVVRMASNAAITVVAGDSAPSTFADGQGTSAKFYSPQGIAVRANGTVLVADTTNHRIRAISPSGAVTTIAGGSTAAFLNGQGTAARFSSPRDMVILSNGTTYVADSGNHRIRAISPTGAVTTVAGTGTSGSTNGAALTATFTSPIGLAMSPNGTLYIVDSHRVRALLTNGTVTTVTGSTTAAFADGQGTTARFSTPKSAVCASNGTLYVVDSGNRRIRSISPTGYVSTIASNLDVAGIAITDGGTLYISDPVKHYIRAISPTGVSSIIAGSGIAGAIDGSASSSQLNGPTGIAISENGTLYVADTKNHRIRLIRP